LPEVDGNAPGAFVQRGFLTGAAGFRFTNFMEIWANYDTDTRAIVGHGFTPDSGLYRSPSYRGIPSQVGTPMQSVKVGVEPITFIQTTGARTQSPERIGGLFGGPIGNIVASAVKSFPPIWTEIQIQLFGDGHIAASVRRWSLFPSMTFYTRSIALDSTVESVAYTRTASRPGNVTYDGMPNYDNWYANGWGDLGPGPGPIAGNPWGLDKSVLSGIDPSQPFGW
jgi:hypothetical protein